MANKPVALPEENTIKDAYFYLLGRVYAIRQEQMDIEKTPYNTIKYNPLGSESADFVNPNLDVVYWETWVAADDEHAVVLNVPEIKNRYYTVQVLDGWGEVIANVNERNYPEHPWGKIAFVKKGTAPEVPSDALVIELPSNKTKVLGRVELSATPQEAVALQKAFTLEVPQGINVAAVLEIPEFKNPQLPGVWVFEMANEILDSYPDSMPDAPKLAQTARDIAACAAASDAVKGKLQDMITNTFSPYFYQEIIGRRAAVNGWSLTDFGGRFGNDFYKRTLVNFGGIWANVPEEVVYYSSHQDAKGDHLSGSAAYSIRFEADALPDSACDSFWSITLLRLPDYRVVPNPLNRFSINNVSDTKRDQDGSLTLYLAPELPEGVPQGNWLPSPKGMDLNLTFRLYVPNEKALNKTWSVPKLNRIG